MRSLLDKSLYRCNLCPSRDEASGHDNWSCYTTGFIQNLKILENPWIRKQKVLEYINKCLKVLKLSCFSGYFLKFLALRIGHFVNWFCSCLTKAKAVWNSLKLAFEQFKIAFYWFLPSPFQPLILEFPDTWSWKCLKSPSCIQIG
jgi:hypothetical protein